MDEKRIIGIEERLAYQEQALNELNDVMTDQQAQLTRLERIAETLRDRVEALASGERDEAPQDERPPHY